MGIHTIISGKTNAVLYEGEFDQFKTCIEDAVTHGADLGNADFRNKNLSNICLDDARLGGANFSGANLTGANLSEARLSGAIFQNADLYNTCFAYSDLKGCDFCDAAFGATDIAGSDISAAKFSTLSCFTLDFTAARRMDNCRFTNEDDRTILFSRPPVTVRGLGGKLLVFTEQSWLLGNTILPYPEQFRPLPFWPDTKQPERKVGPTTG